MPEADLSVVSHEQGGRILSGVGASADDLAATMDRHTPEDAQVEPVAEKPAEPAQADGSGPIPAITPEKPPTRGQKRFADLTREREDARREAAATKAELDALRAQMASTPSAAPAQSVQAPAAAPIQAEPTRVKPTEDEIGAKYASYADFVEDLAEWKVEQRHAAHDIDARIRTAIEADRASRSFQDTVSTVLEAGRKAFPDFDAVRAASDVKLPSQLIQTVLAMDNAAHVIYKLAKDRDLAQRIATSDPYHAGLLLAGLRVASPDAVPASSGTPSVTPPPPPYQPVAGGARTTVTPSAELPDKYGHDFDASGYREKRAAERGVRRR